MKYRIVKNIHNNFSYFEKNKLAPRAYAVAYSSAEALKNTCIRDERYSSDMVTVLSGEWNFKYYKSIADVPDSLNTAKVKFDTVTVPSDWQRTGYEEPVYLNCPYEIKTIAPEVPADMSVGIYRKTISLETVSHREIISFLGVSNNLSLYVNGKFVGYSEGSHNTAEFDITSLLTAGENEIVAVMFKWCNGTFLEAQDMFRENGIFRDVLLFNYNEAYLYDYDVATEKSDKGYNLTVKTVLGDNKNCFVKAAVLTQDGAVLCEKTVHGEEDIIFTDLDVTEWNAEIPTCYTLFLTVTDKKEAMTVRQTIGFKTITIENGVFRVNGQPIKVKGVNHHDTDLMKGFSMNLADMERDVRLMKELNCNGVRTSHYPPDPFFITLCDLYGLYVIDEADIETHGCGEMFDDVSHLSMDLRWAKHYIDRVRRMYYRDRNHPSILMWSLGNESGGYKCHDRCYQFLKSTGTPIPVHYEGAVRTKRFHYDVISEMYTSTEEIEAMIAGKRIRQYDDVSYHTKEYSKYPFYLCEYCHAMGVGPGNLEEYWDLFYKWDNSMGGCIWEWADHTVYHDENDKKYKYKYTYGGDHGEKQHDGHFCVDGLMYADRRLHTGAKCMKVVYRPLRAEYKGEGVFTFTNTNRFRDSAYIATKYDLQIDGVSVLTGELELNIPAMGTKDVTIAGLGLEEGKDCYINFIYTDRETGLEIALEQVELQLGDCEYDIEIGNKISAESENGILSVVYDNGKAMFDGNTGDLISYTANGKEILNVKPAEATGFNANLYRALIDNDARMREEWEAGGLHKLKKSLVEFSASIEDGEIVVDSLYVLKSGRKAMYSFFIKYVISSLGAMEIKTGLKKLSADAVTDIPRFGLTLELDRSFTKAKYFGRGEAENMPDFKAQSPVGIFEADIADMYEPYVFPQENGMHCDTRWLELSDGENVVRIYGDKPFGFSAHYQTQKAIDKAQHQEDLKDMNTTFLTIDGYLRGIGSSSCGPDTREEFRLNAGKMMEFSFTIIPMKG